MQPGADIAGLDILCWCRNECDRLRSGEIAVDIIVFVVQFIRKEIQILGNVVACLIFKVMSVIIPVETGLSLLLHTLEERLLYLVDHVESNEDEELRAERQSESGHKYAKSALALIIPIIYCLLDALGTFADSRVLEVLDEDAANTAYELTFFLVGIVCFVFLLVKKQKFIFKAELPKYTGAVFETIGQFFYIYALADSRHVAFAAPIISSYCAASVIWSRLFLKEKLSKKHYAAIVTVIAGVIILGILDI